jgi:RNA polymerase primary sigma factor
MKLCVEQCKMPKKNFITLFTGNETSETWFNAAIAMNKPWSEKLHDVKEDVTAACRNCSRLKKRPA